MKNHRFRVLAAFVLLYLSGGSKYVGVRIAVEHIPPALLGALRFGIAGFIMLAGCMLSGRQIMVTRSELYRLTIAAVLMLTLGSVVLAWAQQFVTSGLAALIASSVPLWFLVIDSWILRGPRLSPVGLLGLAFGAVGIVVLLSPKLTSEHWSGNFELLAAIVVLFSAVAWAAGSVLSSRYVSSVDPFVTTGLQMTVAGMINISLAFVLGEHHRVTWEANSLLAVGYLIVAGSLINFTAYIWLLRRVPSSKVSTYAYINPVVAVFLGWLLVGEEITPFIAIGACIILSGVLLVTISKVSQPHSSERRMLE